jgi:D-lactate dehydrogenase
VENLPGAPALLTQLPKTAAAILVEYQAENAEDIAAFRVAASHLLPEIKLLHDAEFTEDPARQAALWKLRKGIIPSVGAMRPPATTLLTEDVVFPVPRLAEAVTDLQNLFDEHGYPEGVVFGHAKDGNLHFLIAQSFNTDSEIRRFSKFIDDLVRLVSGKYDGALKAEHGTGRNMAPFVETEWGAHAYAIMRDLKSLLDPDGLLNPGVVINPDPQAHLKNVKSMAEVASEVDQCIECGFCESKCPSRRLTLTPRQRIVVRREISHLRNIAPDSPQLASLIDDYSYAGNDTCALDGLCATACPVNINTGDLTRRLRAESHGPRSRELVGWMARNFGLVEKTIGVAVRLGHLADRLAGKRWYFLLRAAEKLAGRNLPKWNSSIPSPTRHLRPLDRLKGEKDYIYFPSCISRQLGEPPHDSQTRSLAETLITVAQRAHCALRIPADVTGHCCGMPFNSKGYSEAYRYALHATLMKFWDWSEHGRYPIVIDTTSCAHTLRTCAEALSEDDKALHRQLTILDSIEFLHDVLLPKLDISPTAEEVVLHPNCSARKLGLDSRLVTIARRCAKSVSLPLNLDCCGFAGDRGLLFPELTAAATSLESHEVLARAYDGYYSSNITCEMGMRAATGKDYMGIVYLVEKVSRP